MADYTALIEQLDDWRDRLLTATPATKQDALVIGAVVREINDVVADLRRDGESDSGLTESSPRCVGHTRPLSCAPFADLPDSQKTRAALDRWRRS